MHKKLINKLSKQSIMTVIFCGLLMVLGGASDALRGVFLPTFEKIFSLSKFQSSMIIMMSYVGNLLFLFIGGYIVDRVSRKKFIAVVIVMWMSALVVYVFSENYIMLLIFIIFSMGGSTMLTTTVNIITPLCFASAAFFINFFSFLQGVGISGAQSIGGNFADSIKSWRIINAVLLIGGIICLILLIFVKIPSNTTKSNEKGSYFDVFKNPACKYLILICGLYAITEHGLQNWLVTYGSEYLGFTVSRSAFFLSIFFGGITIGRLISAPLVQKFGIMKSMSIYLSVATILYTIGLLLERNGIILVCISGFAFSILWPTIVLLISKYYPLSQTGIATGFITGISTSFDIVFNAGFGKIVELLGFGISFKILPISMVLFCISFFLLRFRVKASKSIY